MTMTDLIVAFVILVVAVCSAELVRLTCRRQLLTPVRTVAPAGTGTRAQQLSH
jgi:hypothetical protein